MPLQANEPDEHAHDPCRSRHFHAVLESDRGASTLKILMTVTVPPALNLMMLLSFNVHCRVRVRAGSNVS